VKSPNKDVKSQIKLNRKCEVVKLSLYNKKANALNSSNSKDHLKLVSSHRAMKTLPKKNEKLEIENSNPLESPSNKNSVYKDAKPVAYKNNSVAKQTLHKILHKLRISDSISKNS
jgi:hypothetical protein